MTTLHGRLDLPELGPIFDEYAEMPVVSISDAQRTPLPGANWLGTVYTVFHKTCIFSFRHRLPTSHFSAVLLRKSARTMPLRSRNVSECR